MSHSHLADAPPAGVTIVGGSSGVGLASARQFAAAGAERMLLVGRDPQRGESAAQGIRRQGTDCVFLSADAGSAAGSAEIAAAVRSVGTADAILIATAPTSIVPTPLAKLEQSAPAAILHELLLPTVSVAHAVLPIMRERGGGSLIAVASDAAKIATPGESLIGAAMAAIVMFVRTLALEEKRHGIRANVLTPSLIADTGLSARLAADEFSAALFDRAAKRAQLGVPRADDLAQLVLFLAGPGAQRLTGQAISVNGGISAA